MYKKCHACKKPHPEVGKVSPESHRSAPYFPQHTNFSSTCGSNNDRNHCFHFLSNWRRNGARDKNNGEQFLKQMLLGLQEEEQGKGCDLSNLPNLLPRLKKVAEPANAVLPFPFRPSAAAAAAAGAYHRTFVSLPFLMSCGPQLSPCIPTNLGQNWVKTSLCSHWPKYADVDFGAGFGALKENDTCKTMSIFCFW